ncbi:MAG: hypothetical protein JWP37_111 [Mucilaginibacter sp.]|nr:hypothetical protein [Mucilaginibacter sp.]
MGATRYQLAQMPEVSSAPLFETSDGGNGYNKVNCDF